MIKDGKYDWANWTLTKYLSHKQNVQYACFAAKQSLHYVEKKVPNDKRPRKAISAALKWTKDPSEVNKHSAARAATEAAWKKILKYGLKLCK